MCSDVRLVAAGHLGIVLVRHHQVPAVEAVLAPIRDHVTRLPDPVLGRVRQQEAAAAAVDAGDLGRRCEHVTSLAGRRWPVRTRILGVMRVVAGELGGRRLVAPAGTSTRPTTDRVREAIFNSLGSAGLVDGALVADLFAGSGAIGIEALSRGAHRCVFVERDRAALRALDENLDALDLDDRSKVLASDAMSVAASLDADIVFADPPYDFDAWDDLLGRVSADLVVAESGAPVAAPDGWEVTREKKYGRTRVTFLERTVGGAVGSPSQ